MVCPRGSWALGDRKSGAVGADMVFDEHQSRMRERNSTTNLAIIRRMVLNMLRQDQTGKLGLRPKRLKAGWDNDYLRQLLNFMCVRPGFLCYVQRSSNI